MQNLTETVEILGPPFTVEGVRAALARGKFRGLGRKWGGQWFTTEEDRAAMLERLRIDTTTDLDTPVAEKSIPTVGASGASARSPRYRNRQVAS